MLLHLINTLLPVFAAILLGYLLARHRFLRPPFISELNRLVFWVALPAFILASLGRSARIPTEAFSLFALFTAATLLLLGLAFTALRLLAFPAHRRGTFLQAAFRGNLAFIGIPILSYVLRGQPAHEVDATLRLALVLFAPTMLLYNGLAVVLLAHGRPHPAAGAARRPGILRQIALNPLILAAVAGMALCVLPWKLPAACFDALDYVGRLAGPAALICVGAAMAAAPIARSDSAAWAAAGLKVFALPLLMGLLALPFDLAPQPLLMLLIFSAAPTAAASYVMAAQMGGDEALASRSIVLSTLLSIPALALVIALFPP